MRYDPSGFPYTLTPYNPQTFIAVEYISRRLNARYQRLIPRLADKDLLNWLKKCKIWYFEKNMALANVLQGMPVDIH